MAENEKSGCLKAFLIVLVLFIVLIMLAAYFLYTKGGDIVRSTGAAALEASAQSMLQDAGYSEQEKTRIMEPIKVFAEKIRSKQVNLEQMGAVVEEFAAGGAMAALMLSEFQKKYLEPSSLSAQEKAEAAKNISRYVEGVSLERIPQTATKELYDIIVEQTGDAEDDGETRKLKEKLQPQELAQFLDKLKQTADQAGIEDKEYVFDLAAEIAEAIEKGMTASAEKAGKE